MPIFGRGGPPQGPGRRAQQHVEPLPTQQDMSRWRDEQIAKANEKREADIAAAAERERAADDQIAALDEKIKDLEKGSRQRARLERQRKDLVKDKAAHRQAQVNANARAARKIKEAKKKKGLN